MCSPTDYSVGDVGTVGDDGVFIVSRQPNGNRGRAIKSPVSEILHLRSEQ
jgi:hypothetical protein